MIITICGSMRFSDEMLREYARLSVSGHIVLLPAFTKLLQEEHLDRSILRSILRSLHDEKILMSDRVVVVCPEGYIGDDTRREIEFAKKHHIPVMCTCTAEEFKRTEEGWYK